jgi:hypothetical protein
LRFHEKEPSNEDKTEKTLTTMLPSDRILKYQYHARNYQHYSDLIHDLLQAEEHDELTMRNHHQRHVGTTALSEANYSAKGREKVDDKKTIKTNLVNSKKAKETISTRRANSKVKVWGKERNLLSATDVVPLIIVQRIAIFPNTWLICTRNP